MLFVICWVEFWCSGCFSEIFSSDAELPRTYPVPMPSACSLAPVPQPSSGEHGHLRRRGFADMHISRGVHLPLYTTADRHLCGVRPIPARAEHTTTLPARSKIRAILPTPLPLIRTSASCHVCSCTCGDLTTGKPSGQRWARRISFYHGVCPGTFGGDRCRLIV